MGSFAGDPSGSPEFVQEHHSPELERALLRNGVTEMAAHRWRCSDCGRSPLVGECLNVFRSDSGDRRICELCLPARQGSLGEPVRVERVRAAERRLSVRRAA